MYLTDIEEVLPAIGTLEVNNSGFVSETTVIYQQEKTII